MVVAAGANAAACRAPCSALVVRIGAGAAWAAGVASRCWFGILVGWIAVGTEATRPGSSRSIARGAAYVAWLSPYLAECSISSTHVIKTAVFASDGHIVVASSYRVIRLRCSRTATQLYRTGAIALWRLLHLVVASSRSQLSVIDRVPRFGSIEAPGRKLPS